MLIITNWFKGQLSHASLFSVYRYIFFYQIVYLGILYICSALYLIIVTIQMYKGIIFYSVVTVIVKAQINHGNVLIHCKAKAQVSKGKTATCEFLVSLILSRKTVNIHVWHVQHFVFNV